MSSNTNTFNLILQQTKDTFLNQINSIKETLSQDTDRNIKETKDKKKDEK